MTFQSLLPLPSEPSFEKIDFCVSDSNREAYTLIQAWPKWPHFCSIVYGPKGSGKTFLGKLYQEISGAKALAHLSEGVSVEASVLIDDLDLTGSLNSHEEKSLFHMYNSLKENKKNLLILTSMPPMHWCIRLADLKSRLRSAYCVGLLSPDDFLIKTLYAKYFSDLQLKVSSQIIDYIVKNTDRSFQSMQYWAKTIAQESLTQKRNITLPFVRSILIQLEDKSKLI